jgi:phage tail-like protein
MSVSKLLETSLTNNQSPPAGFHFAVVFFTGGTVPNALDMRFKKVTGLGSDINTATVKEGGENLFSHRLPNRVSYNNLVLERGIIVGSPLNIEFNAAMSNYQFNPGNALVTLLDDSEEPLAAWLFLKTYPVKWNVSDLAADVNGVVIETMELAYTRFQVIQV